jgi:hypothetical protein
MRRLALVLAAVLPVALSACGDSTGPGSAVAGTYTLRSINGDPVPVTYDESPDFRTEILSGFLRLNANGTFSATHTQRLTVGTTVTIRTNDTGGTYTLSGDDLILRFEDPVSGIRTDIPAVRDGDRLTLDDEVDIWVYER